MNHAKPMIGRSPLTDPRSLGSSLLFHILLILVASAAALSVTVPERPELPHTLRGELDAVDNRPAKEGGGAPGELGGMGLVPVLPRADGASPDGAARDPAAEALLSEILPTQNPTDGSHRALPGPQTTGIGVLPGPGTGGGGGSGGGSGGGVGRGVGPGTEFFGARERAGSFAYVIDCSGSMAMRGSLDVAKRELMASLSQLPPDAQFAVVFYNLESTVFTDPSGRKGLMAATASNKARVRSQLTTVVADGGTDHMLALRTAFSLRPEVVFFLTDADLMSNADVDELLKEHGKSRIQAVEFGRGSDLAGENAPISRLARTTGGSFRYIDVTKFPNPPK
jgi:hypothetical protein